MPRKMLHIFRTDHVHLLAVVGGIQFGFVERRLAVGRVEKISAFRHPRAGQHAGVAFGINEPAAVRRGRDVEFARHQNRRAIEHRERFPAFVLETEHRARSMHADHVQAQRLAQLLVDLAEHLVGLDDFDAMIAFAQHGLAQPVNRARAHAGLKSRAEIHAQAVGRLMIQRGDQSFARSHGWHGANATRGNHHAIIFHGACRRQLPILKNCCRF